MHVCLEQLNTNTALERCTTSKKQQQLYCSGCTRRGHLVHACRVALPFSGLPLNSPYVCCYRAVLAAPAAPPAPATPHEPRPTTPATPARNERNKRQSKSPTVHETHLNKKRNLSSCEDSERRNTKSPVTPQRKTSVSKDADDNHKKDNSKSALSENTKSQGAAEKAPNFIPISSANHDKKGNMIQDNEVSDTSDIITSARIYITNDIIEKLNTDEGKAWLNATTEKNGVEVEDAEIKSFLGIKGRLVDQEAFQRELRDWAKPQERRETINKPSNEGDTTHEKRNENQGFCMIPKNRINFLKQLNKALNSLKEDIGDPTLLYKELMYLQNRQQQLMKAKAVSPQQLTNNRGHINQMLKKLNMVLLGQAGLAHGSKHVSELYSIQEKLMNLRQKTIPIELRKEIGVHYITVFTAFPRNDYTDLLKMYHMPKKTILSKQEKKEKRHERIKLLKLNRLMKKVNSIPTQQIQPIQNGNEENVAKTNEVGSASKHPIMLQKLVFYHKRLMSARPTGSPLKKTRLELVRKLHSYIASMFKKENLSSKALKKIRKTQEQAQLFLANV